MREHDPTEDGDDRRAVGALAALFAGIAALAGVDLISDMSEGASLGHVAIEALLLVVGLVGLAAMLRRFLRLSKRARSLVDEAESLNAQLDARTAEAERWRSEAQAVIEGLGVAIDRQFDRWALTPAEKEVGLLLLKGLSHKEIAEVRGVSSATTRQQARELYRKADLAGRHDLAAFFLEDLLLPSESGRR